MRNKIYGNDTCSFDEFNKEKENENENIDKCVFDKLSNEITKEKLDAFKKNLRSTNS